MIAPILEILLAFINWRIRGFSRAAFFIFGLRGFFDVKSRDGMGKGYFATTGLHYEVPLGDDLFSEETYLYVHDELHLISSVRNKDYAPVVRCESLLQRVDDPSPRLQ